jgi:L-fuculose-phosphate aldolase
VLTTLGSIPIAEYATPSTKELPEAVRKYIKAHDGMLLANHGALTVGSDLFGAYYKMETIEHFAKISLVARQLGRENLLSRAEVNRLQELRGAYGIKAPAPICVSGTDPQFGSVPVHPDFGSVPGQSCQVVQAPAGTGARLVPDNVSAKPDPPSLAQDRLASFGEVAPKPLAQADAEEEIRLTYRELTALIQDAIRSLR